MIDTFDTLYRESMNGKIFDNLLPLISSRENILLAYRSMKTNKGSRTPGADGLAVKDISKLASDEVVVKVQGFLGSSHYRTRLARRVDIKKESDPAKTRPLSIPGIWDRLVQQCVKQILEPICEAKFSESSHGFRPNRSCENAIAHSSRLANLGKLEYVLELDIKAFFDEVDHAILIQKFWSLGIRDTKVLHLLEVMLRTPILMMNGDVVHPAKGTMQGGIISPHMANVHLNSMDHMLDKLWEKHPMKEQYPPRMNPEKKVPNCDRAYREMRKAGQTEVHLVRYADDSRIFCRTHEDAEAVKKLVESWLGKELKLEVSPAKTRIVNLKKQNSVFLGFRFKLRKKLARKPSFKKEQAQKKENKAKKIKYVRPKYKVKSSYVIVSHISRQAMDRIHFKASETIKKAARPSGGRTAHDMVNLYNSQVMGWHSYYSIATMACEDFSIINFGVNLQWYNRLKEKKKKRRKPDEPRVLSETFKRLYGSSKQIRWVHGQAAAPLSAAKFRAPKEKAKDINSYTPEGRKKIHGSLKINTGIMLDMMRQMQFGRSIEFMDNRISLFCAQLGKCAVTGRTFASAAEVHCHHKICAHHGGSDKYRNLVLVMEEVHLLTHASTDSTMHKYMAILNLNAEGYKKLNARRMEAGERAITAEDRKIASKILKAAKKQTAPKS
jgi:group II intron reverse transcriptase/maturase